MTLQAKDAEFQAKMRVKVRDEDLHIPINATPQFGSTFWRGAAAWQMGKPRSACPYRDHRAGPHGNIVTFSRAYRRYWHDGWDAAKRYANKAPDA